LSFPDPCQVLTDAPSHNDLLEEKAILLTGPLRNILKAQRILLEKISSLAPAVKEAVRPKPSRAMGTAKGA
jgi:hypothetical protein